MRASWRTSDPGNAAAGRRILTTTARGRGLVLAVVGPDGSGKTTVADALARALPAPVRRLHHRPQILPAKTNYEGRVVTEPHADPLYGRGASLLKVVYLYCDWIAGWFLHIRPLRARGGSVVIERGWWDVIVDQRRYRLDTPPALLHRLGRLLPRPDLTVVMTGTPSVLYARKAELPETELARQIQAWSTLPAGFVRPLYVDSDVPLDEVLATLEQQLRSRGWPIRPLRG